MKTPFILRRGVACLAILFNLLALGFGIGCSQKTDAPALGDPPGPAANQQAAANPQAADRQPTVKQTSPAPFTRPTLPPQQTIKPAKPPVDVATILKAPPSAEAIAKVKGQYAKSPQRPLPLIGVADQRAQREELLAWSRELFLDPFKKSGKRGQALEAEAITFLEGYSALIAGHPSAPPLKDLYNQAVKLLLDEFYDPMAYYGAIDICLRGYQAGITLPDYPNVKPWNLAARASRAIVTNKYWQQYPHVACLTNLQCYRIWRLRDQGSRAIYNMLKAISAPGLTKLQRRRLLTTLSAAADDRALREHRKRLLSDLLKASNADPWIVKMQVGRELIHQAWQIRGSGFAADLTREQGEGFNARLRQARSFLLEAWLLHPDCPEAAAELITVTMAIGGVAGESTRFWFDEAVAADPEYTNTFDKYISSLRPRWGGSHSQLLKFGRECLSAGRFDTPIPWYYHHVIRRIAAELADPAEAYQLPGVYEEHETLLKGYRALAETDQQRRFFDSQLAGVMFLAGKTEPAKKAFEKLRGNVEQAALREVGLTLADVLQQLGEVKPTAAKLDQTQGPFVWPAGQSRVQVDLPLVQFTSVEGVSDLRYAGDRQALLATTPQNGVFVWARADRFQQAAGFRGNSSFIVIDADLSPDGRLLALGGMDGDDALVKILLIDTASGKRLRTLRAKGKYTSRVRFSPDGRLLASGGSKGQLNLWNLKTFKLCDWGRIKYRGTISGLAFSPDGRSLAVAAADRSLDVVDLPHRFDRQLKPLQPRYSIDSLLWRAERLDFSPDGTQLLISGQNSQLWETATNRKLLTLAGRGCAFSWDGKQLLTCNLTGAASEARIWNAMTGEEIVRLQGGHVQPIISAVFSPDGNQILTVDRQGVFRAWSAKTGQLLDHFRADSAGPQTARNVTASEKSNGKPVSETWLVNSIGMEFAQVNAGRFRMGSPASEANRQPDEVQHDVKISNSFWMGRFEVTQQEYQMIMKGNTSRFVASKAGKMKNTPVEAKIYQTEHLPVENVNWHEAVEFCQRLSDLPAEKEAGRRYRLPTEAEWEYACRAGSTTAYAFGATLSPEQANINISPRAKVASPAPAQRPRTVGSYPPNAMGIYDMHGNVWEWCQDWYGPYPTTQAVDPQGPSTGDKRVLRGSGWFLDGSFCRSAGRNREPPTYRSRNLGFRVVCQVHTESAK